MKTKYYLLYLGHCGASRVYEPKIYLYDKSMELFSVPIEDLWVNAYGDAIEIRMSLWAKPHLIPDPSCSFFYSMPKRCCS